MIYHVAGEPDTASAQRCLRCGVLLIDNDGAQYMPGQGPMFFPAYRLIAQQGAGWWVANDAAADDVREHLCINKAVLQ